MVTWHEHSRTYQHLKYDVLHSCIKLKQHYSIPYTRIIIKAANAYSTVRNNGIRLMVRKYKLVKLGAGAKWSVKILLHFHHCQ